MTTYAETLRRHRRLSLLRILAEAPAYEANESLLTDVVNHFGVTSTRDQVRTELAWLAEQGLATTEEPGGVRVAKVTQRGLDVAAGRAIHPDVQKPSPRA